MRKNVSGQLVGQKLLEDAERLKEMAEENNRIDAELYSFVKRRFLNEKELVKRNFRDGFEKRTNIEKRVCIRKRDRMARICRGLYYNPIVKAIRVFGGLPAGGSY